MPEMLDYLETIERFDREGRAPQLGEITERQRDIYTAPGFDPPKLSLC
jgi:hypothetical protein